MSELYRFGVSLEKALIDTFDRHIEAQHYKSRSEALRDLIREELIRKQWTEGGTVAGAIVMTYDHHKRELVNLLLDIQHDFQETIISTQHVHLDHHHCLEIIAVKGRAADVEKLATTLKVQVGVKHLSLSISSSTD
ncbi:nickel-responsive transcriptional regulator NikR [Chlorobium sp. BLA1]|uniref:nickel-responsive transcriptional regulator NikR n=1 Tax=Candidatus Chlorobium masyuteum TaxID=2716876 RepID=UPI001423313C|nr:nickel-responsive transcriptional regulator NikR [Candidatus Chlorobium masyuteum]NHQ59289.1 nickel-responsive transcriptional regulator NikR [Candidatus Chlorobium masyuteum]NTU45064.1 nickel-responsive transcriptional regulator NikR [Chlorobiaceae bacterium]